MAQCAARLHKIASESHLLARIRPPGVAAAGFQEGDCPIRILKPADPRDATACSGRALAYGHLGRYDEALRIAASPQEQVQRAPDAAPGREPRREPGSLRNPMFPILNQVRADQREPAGGDYVEGATIGGRRSRKLRPVADSGISRFSKTWPGLLAPMPEGRLAGSCLLSCPRGLCRRTSPPACPLSHR
jgi:hypothetical protein